MTARWTTYYDNIVGRTLRPLFLQGLDLAGAPSPEDVAVELGCGDGTETEALLAAGWRVVAMDASADGVARTQERCARHGSRLTADVATFETFRAPPCRLLVSLYSLPFCDPAAFPEVWQRSRDALEPGGTLAVTLFGDRDTWVGTEGMTFHDRGALDQVLEGLDVASLNEIDEDGGTAFGEQKHWHVWEIVARKPV